MVYCTQAEARKAQVLLDNFIAFDRYTTILSSNY
jgi:hypothetical protein